MEMYELSTQIYHQASKEFQAGNTQEGTRWAELGAKLAHTISFAGQTESVGAGILGASQEIEHLELLSEHGVETSQFFTESIDELLQASQSDLNQIVNSANQIMEMLGTVGKEKAWEFFERGKLLGDYKAIEWLQTEANATTNGPNDISGKSIVKPPQ